MTKKTNNSGSILVLVLVVMLVTMAIGAGMLTLGTQSRMSAIRRSHIISARAAADAGLDLAIFQINSAVAAGSWSLAVKPHFEAIALPDSKAVFTVATNYNASEGYRLQSTGTCSDRVRTVQAVLGLRGLFDEALLCQNTMSLKSGTRVQCIDSDISLNPDDTDEKVVIGTNSTQPDSVILNNGVVVDGDIVVGVGGNVNTVIKDQGAQVDNRYTLSSDVEFPSVTPPTLTGPDTAISVKTGEKTIGSGGDYPAVGRISDITMKQGTRLRVVGHCTLHITGDVDMGQSSEILIDSTVPSSLKIYLNGNWNSGNDSGINNTTSLPKNFSLFGIGEPGQKIDLKAKSDFFGSIYAPDADVTVFSGGDLYGSFSAGSFELKNPANFFYDVALRDVSVSDEGAHFTISRWTEN